jgi:hypothetical protein
VSSARAIDPFALVLGRSTYGEHLAASARDNAGMARQSRVEWLGPDVRKAKVEYVDSTAPLGPRDLRVSGAMKGSAVRLRVEYGMSFLLNQGRDHLANELVEEYRDTLGRAGIRRTGGAVVEIHAAMTNANLVRALYALLKEAGSLAVVPDAGDDGMLRLQVSTLGLDALQGFTLVRSAEEGIEKLAAMNDFRASRESDRVES